MTMDCAICGHSLLLETLYGRSILVLRVEGIDEDQFVHKHCREMYLLGMSGWDRRIPDGPLKALLKEKALDGFSTAER